MPDEYISDFRKAWIKLSPEDKALYDQDELDFLVLLSMDPDHIYTSDEIQTSLDSPVTERGLRLVIARRSGQFKTGMKVSPHIKYNALLDHNEEGYEPFSAPEFSTVTDKERSAALGHFMKNEAAPVNLLSELVKDVTAATISPSAVGVATPVPVHVQEPTLPELISPLDPRLLSTQTENEGAAMGP
ncbi:hypothetical protein GMDG_08673 [Pseudogymnoascus destructans 20631-21]|uniref:Uncharacterized protein n=1 Tax=Pseudogymnoascus destructans (strain ATCC MYA-4855 / 20631-21) TaxID=658429 RepID=L8G7Q9_PSED2|nr:hypothetical protein GMDG_08673 [Pseudogymnoascus destructans 20631-21]